MGGKHKDETSDAPGSGMRFERADLGGLAPAQESAAGRVEGSFPDTAAGGSSGSCSRGFDRAPGRIPQRSEWPR